MIHDFTTTPVINYTSDFAEISDTGAVHLYLHKRKAQQTGSTGANSGFGTTYHSTCLEEQIVIKNNSTDYLCIRSKRTLEDAFLPIIEDYPELHR